MDGAGATSLNGGILEMTLGKEGMRKGRVIGCGGEGLDGDADKVWIVDEEAEGKLEKESIAYLGKICILDAGKVNCGHASPEEEGEEEASEQDPKQGAT